jgi:Amidohydrolase family
VVFVADSEAMMRRAEAIAKEFNLRYVLSGARQGYRFADELKTSNIPVLVSVKWPVAPTNKDDREEQPLRLIRDRQLAPTTPSVLAKNGVSFALVSGPAKTAEFIPGIRKAIENGLSDDDALRAVTISPARIFGVDRQLGTLEKGKIANVVITDKPIFSKDAKVKRVFIDGREAKLPTEEEKAKRGAGEAAASPIEGAWNLTVKTPQGDVSIIATLHLESGHLTGTFSGDRGSGDIHNGSLDGSTVEFTISVRSTAESGDWVFHGTLHDSTMDGSVSTTLGTFQFSGSKSK